MIEQAWNYKSVVAKDSNNTGDSGSGSGSKYLPKYYSIDWDIAEEGWIEVLKDASAHSVASTAKGGGVIAAYIPPIGVEAFSFLPVGVKRPSESDVTFFETLESVIDFLKASFDISISMNGIKEISEEEYYSFDMTVPEG